MSKRTPSLREWERLYAAALQFKEIESWKWMTDSDLFGVQDPLTAEIGYCCVLGNLGEVFGLAVYLGTEGLKGYLDIQMAETRPSPEEVLNRQRCLMASFEDRRFLEQRDIQIIKKLGLRFRGHNQWPLFRSYCPGYHPWYLTAKEAGFLALALQQAIEVCLQFKQDPDMLISPKPHCLWVKVPYKQGRALKWKGQWLKPKPMKIKLDVVDEIRLEKVRKKQLSRGGIWEVGLIPSPMGVKDSPRSRPYYPHIWLWVDHHSYLVLNSYMAEPSSFPVGFLDQFLKAVETVGLIPEEVWVRREEVFMQLELLAERLNFKLNLVDTLEALEDVRTSMFDYFQGSETSL